MAGISSRKMRFCIMLALFSFFNSQFGFAANQKKQETENVKDKSGWFVGVEAGSAWPSLKGHTTVPNGSSAPPPNDNDFYTIGKNTSTVTEGGFYVGYRFIGANEAFPSCSLAARYQHLSPFKIQGVIQQYSLPDFTNYNYNFSLASNIFTLQGKVDLHQIGMISPYISAGIGMASNYLSGYYEQAMADVIPRVSPAFQDNTLNNTTFNVGVGFDVRLNDQLSATLGYEYANLGTIHSHAGAGEDWMADSISFGTLTTQAVLLSITYQLS